MNLGSVNIDIDRCKGCGLCVRACPFNVLSMNTKMNSAGVYPAISVNPENCTACASCYQVCPDSAITVFKEDGENI